MCTLWLISVAVVLASIFPSCTAGAVCDRKECLKGNCYGVICTTCGDNCNGTRCADNEVCIANKCLNKDQNCLRHDVNGVIIPCFPRGDHCGKGQFCYDGSQCVNGVCHSLRTECIELANGEKCEMNHGRCKDGICLDPCSKHEDCHGVTGTLCLGGYCADLKCGESICWNKNS